MKTVKCVRCGQYYNTYMTYPSLICDSEICYNKLLEKRKSKLKKLTS